jgi:hypothetical protein
MPPPTGEPSSRNREHLLRNSFPLRQVSLEARLRYNPLALISGLPRAIFIASYKE